MNQSDRLRDATPPDLPAADLENAVPLISPPRRTGYETDPNLVSRASGEGPKTKNPST